MFLAVFELLMLPSSLSLRSMLVVVKKKRAVLSPPLLLQVQILSFHLGFG